MNKKVEQTIIEISRKILYTYFVENQQDYLLSLLAKDIVFVGMGKYLKAEGKEEVYRLFDSGKEQMFPCSMNDELYLARPLGQDYWFCEAQCDLDTQPGLPLFFHECQRTTFIYRRNLQTENKLGWELGAALLLVLPAMVLAAPSTAHSRDSAAAAPGWFWRISTSSAFSKRASCVASAGFTSAAGTSTAAGSACHCQSRRHRSAG